MKLPRKRLVVDLILLFGVVVGGFFAVTNAQAIGDWTHFLRYDPPKTMQNIAEEAGMSAHGKRLFFRFSPQYADAETIERQCDRHALGCAVGQSIYILEADSSREANRSIVTASHEMLHIAYSRLDSSEKERVVAMLDDQIKQRSGGDVTERFSQFSGDVYYNEAHSYVGTEAGSLTNELENYYSQYFDDRQKVIEAYRRSPER